MTLHFNNPLSNPGHAREVIEPSGYYHIYNRSNGYGRLFFEAGHYSYFLRRLKFYLYEYIDIYAYCLLPDHFHLAVMVKPVEVILNCATRDFDMIQPAKVARVDQELHFFNSDALHIREVLENGDEYDNIFRNELAVWVVKERFRRLFLSYAKSVNRHKKRHGSLFQKAYKRRRLTLDQLPQVVAYVHRNPIHHGYAQGYSEYPWSSYSAIALNDTDIANVAGCLSVFGGASDFERAHETYLAA